MLKLTINNNHITIRIKKFVYKFLIFCFDTVAKLIPKIKKYIIKPVCLITKNHFIPIAIKLYSFYLFIKKKVFKTYTKPLSKILFVNKYGIHATIILITMFVVANNLYANTLPDRIINNNSILYSVLTPASIEDDITETIDYDNLVNYSAQHNDYNNKQNNNKSPILTGAGIAQAAEKAKKEKEKQKENAKKEKSNVSKQALRETIITYIVKQGDTLSSIAKEFGISVNTILWENRLRSRHFIKPGQKLTILPTSGISHYVKRGESISRISKKYGIPEEKILAFNELAQNSLIYPGQRLIIPEGEPLYTATSNKKPEKTGPIQQIKKLLTPKPKQKKKISSNKLLWPTDGRVITQYYNWRHHGLDLDGITGDPIYSVDDGVVEISAWNNGGYGYQVLVNHENGIKTRYAHCSKLLLKPGDRIKKGDIVCLMGNTGRSTGSHLHFEVIVNGVRRNPLSYIK